MTASRIFSAVSGETNGLKSGSRPTSPQRSDIEDVSVSSASASLSDICLSNWPDMFPDVFDLFDCLFVCSFKEPEEPEELEEPLLFDWPCCCFFNF